jgi:hypothetical protein
VNPLDVHADTLAKYLEWMNASTSSGSGSSGNSLIPVPSFIWKGAEYACNYSWNKTKYLNAGGFNPLDLLTIEVLEPMADPGPQEEDAIIFQERTFKIRLIALAAGKYPKLVCYDPALGA